MSYLLNTVHSSKPCRKCSFNNKLLRLPSVQAAVVRRRSILPNCNRYLRSCSISSLCNSSSSNLACRIPMRWLIKCRK